VRRVTIGKSDLVAAVVGSIACGAALYAVQLAPSCWPRRLEGFHGDTDEWKALTGTRRAVGPVA
jgi:hypothetical protein